MEKTWKKLYYFMLKIKTRTQLIIEEKKTSEKHLILNIPRKNSRNCQNSTKSKGSASASIPGKLIRVQKEAAVCVHRDHGAEAAVDGHQAAAAATAEAVAAAAAVVVVDHHHICCFSCCQTEKTGSEGFL